MRCVINLDILKDNPGNYEAKSQLMQASLEFFEPKSGQNVALIAPTSTRLDLTDGSVVALPPPHTFGIFSISPDETMLAYLNGQRMAYLSGQHMAYLSGQRMADLSDQNLFVRELATAGR